MWKLLVEYAKTIFVKRRWFVLTLPTLIVRGLQAGYNWLWPLPSDITKAEIWTPSFWSWAFSIVLGVVLAGGLAWAEVFRIYKSLTEGFPRIVLSGQPIDKSPFSVFAIVGGKRAAVRTFTGLRLRFRNSPLVNTENSSATGVNARVKFFAESGQLVCEMDGRWSDSPQLSERDASQDYVAGLSVPFPVGAERSLDIVFQRPGERKCVAVNNDNFRTGRPDLDFPGREFMGTITVVVELNGPRVRCEAKFSLDCESQELVGQIEFVDRMPRM